MALSSQSPFLKVSNSSSLRDDAEKTSLAGQRSHRPFSLLPTPHTMNLPDGLILYDYPRALPVDRRPRLPALLERRLRLRNDDRIHPVQEAIYEDKPRREPPSNRSLEEATVDLVKYIDSNSDEIEHAMNLLRRANCLPVRWDIQDSILVLFNALDKHLFMQKLIGNVKIEDSVHRANGNFIGEILGPNDSGKTIVQLSGRYRASIVLNFESLYHVFRIREHSQAQDYLIAAMLHQMIHTYFLVVCGPQDSEKKSNDLLTHDEHFGIILHKLKAAAPGLPLDFGNTMPEVARYRGRRDDTGGKLLLTSLHADDRKITTECARDVKVLKEDECKDWYKNKCLKALDPDVYVFQASSRSFDTKATSKCGSKSDWVEISHKKNPYKVPKKAVNVFPSLKKKFEDSRKLEISSDVKKETFEEFICFLCEDSDDSVQSLSLRTCVELYQLATSIKFEELKDAMLDAMEGDAMRAELANPSSDTILGIFRAVYNSPTTPDTDLRKWTAQMLRCFSLGALKQVQADTRVSRLRASSAALKQDFDKALRETSVAGHMPTRLSDSLRRPRLIARVDSPLTASNTYAIAAPPTRPLPVRIETRSRPLVTAAPIMGEWMPEERFYEQLSYQGPILEDIFAVEALRRRREFVETAREEQATALQYEEFFRPFF